MNIEAYAAMENELLALLDRIEIENDATLAKQRFNIAEKYGYTVVFGEPVSGAMQ